MAQFVKSHILALAHLPLGLPAAGAFFSRQHVVAIKHPFGLDKHAVGLFAKSHEISFMQVERFEDIARDDYLAALPHAADPLLGCGRLGWHAFRLSEWQKLSSAARKLLSSTSQKAWRRKRRKVQGTGRISAEMAEQSNKIGGCELKSSTKWDGNKLVIITKVDIPNGVIEIKDFWELADSAKTMIVT
jgi:hypothetical protein